jgi:hypothetical protein
MLEITVAIVVLVLSAVGLLEYFRVWRPRALATAAQLHRTAAGAAKVSESAAAVSEAARDRLVQWLAGKATKAEQRLQHLERAVAQVQATQALQFVQSHARALESLRRFDGAPDEELLRSARADLRNGFADLGLYVSASSGQTLLQHHAASLAMIEHAAEAAQLELAVLAALDRLAEQPAAVGSHQRLVKRWQGKLQDLGDLGRQMLPPVVRHGCSGKPALARREQLELLEGLASELVQDLGGNPRHLAPLAEA